MSYGGGYLPPGTPLPHDEQVEHVCSDEDCGNVWDVVMNYELGGLFYYNEDKDPFCPECGAPARD